MFRPERAAGGSERKILAKLEAYLRYLLSLPSAPLVAFVNTRGHCAGAVCDIERIHELYRTVRRLVGWLLACLLAWFSLNRSFLFCFSSPPKNKQNARSTSIITPAGHWIKLSKHYALPVSEPHRALRTTADAEKGRGKEGKEGKKGGGGGVSEELRAEEGEAAALRDLDERCAKGAATRRGYGHMDAANHEFTALVVFAALAPLLSPPTKSTKPTEPTESTESTKSTTMETAMEAATASKAPTNKLLPTLPPPLALCCHHGGDGGGGGSNGNDSSGGGQGGGSGDEDSGGRCSSGDRTLCRLSEGAHFVADFSSPSADLNLSPTGTGARATGAVARGWVLASDAPGRAQGWLACASETSPARSSLFAAAAAAGGGGGGSLRNSLRLPVALHIGVVCIVSIWYS